MAGRLLGKAVQTVDHNGQKISGVVLSPSFGMEIGVVALTQKSTSTFQRHWDISDGSVAGYRPDGMEQLWNRGLKRHGVSYNAEITADGEAARYATLRMAVKGKVSNDDDDDLASIWGSASLFLGKSGGATGRHDGPAPQEVCSMCRV